MTVLAIGVVLGMGIHHDGEYDQRWPYPDSDDLATDYTPHVGETTLLFGTVEAVSPESRAAEVRVDHSDGSFVLTVREFAAAVEPGGVVQVYGMLESDYTIAARRVVVVNESGGAELYKYGVSVIGALLVLVTFFRHWRIDWQSKGFEAR